MNLTLEIWSYVFNARCYVSAVYAVFVCLSVCSSITSGHYTKVAKHRIMQTTPFDRPKTLVSGGKDLNMKR